MAFHSMRGYDDCGEPLVCANCGDRDAGYLGVCGGCAHEAQAEGDDYPRCWRCGGQAEWGEDSCAMCAEEESEDVA